MTKDVAYSWTFSWNIADRRQQVIALVANGYSVREASRMCGVHVRTAQRWANIHLNYREFGRCHSTGRPRISTEEEDEALHRAHEQNPFRSANQIRAAANFPGSYRTVINL